MRLFSFISIIFILLACSGRDRPTTLPKNVDAQAITIELADSLWSLRADTSHARAAREAYEALSKLDSNSIEIWAKLARSFYFCGQYLTQSGHLRDSLFMRGYEVSQVILNKNPEYRNLLFSTGDEKMAVRGLDADALEVLYWGMANYGQWLATKGDLVRLGQRELIWTTLEHIHDLDSTFYYGAYFRYKGALLCRDPASQVDTLAVRKVFDEAIKIAPEYLGNYTLMALYYCPLANDKNLFYQLLTKVVTATPNPSLAYYPENLYEKVLAERLMVRAEKENWFSL